MAPTNIELYEALKRDLNDDAARMIAEVIPKAEDVATRQDLVLIRSDLVSLELRLERRIATLERRMFAMFVLPLWGGIIAASVKFVLET